VTGKARGAIPWPFSALEPTAMREPMDKSFCLFFQKEALSYLSSTST
jgi:hypothetical protein